MSNPLGLAWQVLKGAIRPRSPEEQVGSGTFRTVYGREGEPDVTKLGRTPLTEALMQHALAQTNPDLMMPEKPVRLPGGLQGKPLPQWMLMGEKDLVDTSSGGKAFVIPDMSEHANRRLMPMPVTQERGEPITDEEALTRVGGHDDWKDMQRHLFHEHPSLAAMGITDLEKKNWAKYSDSSGGEQQRIIDLLTAFESKDPRKPLDWNIKHGRMPEPTPSIRREIGETFSALPDMEDFTDPWWSDASESADPNAYEDLLMSRQLASDQSLEALQSALRGRDYL